MNKYEIVGIVGEGAYGIVYKAKNKDNGEHGKYSNKCSISTVFICVYECLLILFELYSGH